MRAILIGISAAFFFAFTFVLNASMELGGGSWIWAASLRFIFMIPLLFVIVLIRGNIGTLFKKIKKQPGKWLKWSFVGFVLFYAPLCFAAAYSPGWLIAGTWQITIVSGVLLTPLFYETIQTKQGFLTVRGKVPLNGLFMSLIILLGIILMQIEQAKQFNWENVLLGIIPVVVASFAYPLGNRKMMELTEGKLDAYQRVLGMSLASLPFWLVLSIYGLFTEGFPTAGQTIQTLLVAVFSGLIATVLFFKATDIVRKDMKKLATVEATQSMEVLFALVGEILLLSIVLPTMLSWLGILIVIIGMVLHSYFSQKDTVVKAYKT